MHECSIDLLLWSVWSWFKTNKNRPGNKGLWGITFKEWVHLFLAQQLKAHFTSKMFGVCEYSILHSLCTIFIRYLEKYNVVPPYQKNIILHYLWIPHFPLHKKWSFPQWQFYHKMYSYIAKLIQIRQTCYEILTLFDVDDGWIYPSKTWGADPSYSGWLQPILKKHKRVCYEVTFVANGTSKEILFECPPLHPPPIPAKTSIVHNFKQFDINITIYVSWNKIQNIIHKQFEL